MNKKKISLIISVVTILFAIVYYFCYFNYNNKNVDENVTKPVINENIEVPEVENKYKEEIDSLRKEYNNDEIVGILSIPNTITAFITKTTILLNPPQNISWIHVFPGNK